MREDGWENRGDVGGDGTAPHISPVTSNNPITFTTTFTNHSITTFTSITSVN